MSRCYCLTLRELYIETAGEHMLDNVWYWIFISDAYGPYICNYKCTNYGLYFRVLIERNIKSCTLTG
jgi:hypothetical protein